MREQLIELVFNSLCNHAHKSCKLAENIVDDLIANGVIVPPCKIGDDIWWIDDSDNSIKCEKNGVKGFIVKKDEILIRDSTGGEDRIGTQYCYLTKEAAEQALKEGTYRG